MTSDRARTRAALRLRSAMNAAVRAGDMQAWLTAATSLQEMLHRQEPDGVARADLRADMIAACEQLRHGWRSRPGRLWVSQDADQVTGPLLRDVLDDPQPDLAEVFALTESARARVLLDALSGCFHGDSGDPAEKGEADRVLAFPPDPDPDPLRREMRLISAVRAVDDNSAPARQAALSAVESMYAGDTGFSGGAEPAALAAVQAVLLPDEVLIEYVVPYHPLHPALGLAALVITGESVQLVPDLPLPERFTRGFIGSYAIDGRAPVDASPMGDMVVGARRAVQSQGPEAARDAGRMLHDTLIQPILDAGLTAGKSRWIIVPHRQLHPVPWMALIDASGNPWLTTTTLTVCPSASIWARLAARPHEGRSALALGDPLAGVRGDACPATGRHRSRTPRAGLAAGRSAGRCPDRCSCLRRRIARRGRRCVGHPPGHTWHLPGDRDRRGPSVAAEHVRRVERPTASVNAARFGPPSRLVHHLECLQRRAVPDRSRRRTARADPGGT